ncbi:MAG: type IV pilus twitching motility protein PilT [Verrucomicrobiales bacterium]
MERINANSKLSEILGWFENEEGASDIHFQAGERVSLRRHGKLDWLEESMIPRMEGEDLLGLLAEALSEPVAQRIEKELEVDLSFYHGQMRYRANFSKQKGAQSFSLRIVPQQRQTLADLNLPSTLADLVKEPRGLILVTGPTAQGKSTTVRALIQQINETACQRIITVEDPIEYVFENAKSQFEQREVGIDTPTFAHGIRNAMRQDPNVIFVGEIRDRESIYSAVQAAETGHLVITTLHADSGPQAIGRIREFYPAGEQPNISSLLSRNLNAIITQRLIPSVDGKRLPCLEIVRRDAGVQEAIRDNQLHMLAGIIEASVGQGMHAFDQYLIELLAAGKISEETTRHYATNKHRLDMLLRGIITQQAILKPDR